MINGARPYRLLSIFCILIIQALFSFKYLARYFPESYLFISWALIGATFLLLYYRPKLSFVSGHALWFGAIVAVVLITILILKYIPIESLNVDRWSVITSFWDAAFNSEYPYAAKSHMNNPPGPMPFYFVIALPFYLGLDYAWMASLGMILFIIWWRNVKMPNGQVAVLILLMFLGLWWEVASRSNIFFNSVLLLFLVYSWLKAQINRTEVYVIAMVTGLLLSTRLVFVIPLLFVFVYLWKGEKIHRVKLLKLAFLAAITFSLTFSPFLLMFPNEFWEINPFIVQGEYLMPTYLTVICVLVCAVLSFFIRNKKQVVWAGGMGLFGTIAVYFAYHLGKVGWNVCLHQSAVDLSYFLLGLPFLLLTSLED